MHDVFIDSNGMPAERRTVGGQQLIIHHADIPPTDVTTVGGIPCTTALRTVIDIASDTEDTHLDAILRDCVTRDLFTMDEVVARISQPDMRHHGGALLLRRRMGVPDGGVPGSG